MAFEIDGSTRKVNICAKLRLIHFSGMEESIDFVWIMDSD